MLLGLAPDEVYHAERITAFPVGSYPAISTLPANRRYIFCCTFCSLTAPGCYPASCPVELGLSSPAKSRSDCLSNLQLSKSNRIEVTEIAGTDEIIVFSVLFLNLILIL